MKATACVALFPDPRKFEDTEPKHKPDNDPEGHVIDQCADDNPNGHPHGKTNSDTLFHDRLPSLSFIDPAEQ